MDHGRKRHCDGGHPYVGLARRGAPATGGVAWVAEPGRKRPHGEKPRATVRKMALHFVVDCFVLDVDGADGDCRRPPASDLYNAPRHAGVLHTTRRQPNLSPPALCACPAYAAPADAIPALSPPPRR